MSTVVQSRSSRETSDPRLSRARFSRTPDRHHLQPNAPRCRTPADFKREPSPFELGDSVDLNIMSSSAIIDKASVMDISGGLCRNVDEYIQLFMTEYCVIDRACYEDVSEPSVKIMVIEEDEDEEVARTGKPILRAPHPMIEEELAKKKLRFWTTLKTQNYPKKKITKYQQMKMLVKIKLNLKLLAKKLNQSKAQSQSLMQQLQPKL